MFDRSNDESLALTIAAQLHLAPHAVRVERFGREVCRLVGEAFRTFNAEGNFEAQMAAWFDAQRPEDQAACLRFLERLDPHGDMNEAIFQQLVKEAVDALP